MFRFFHIFLIKMALSASFVFFIKNDVAAQAWIIDTPTGKLSTWIIQRYPSKPHKAELVFLNHTGQTIQYDPFDTNHNYLEITSPSGLRVITRRKLLDEALFLKNDPSLQKSITWKVDFLKYLEKIDFKENGNYLVTWHLKTTLGTLSAEPVELYFENKTNKK